MPKDGPADFDVAAALDADEEFDFAALFAADGAPEEEPKPRARVRRHRVAFAVSVTIAAIPLLVLDNFQATAEPSEGTHVEATARHSDADADITNPSPFASSEVPEDTTAPTVAKATVFVAAPTTTTTEKPAPTTTTTEKPAPTTTTTQKPAPKPAPTTTVAPAAAASSGSKPDPNSEATWDQLAKCESGGNWQAVSEPRSGVQYYGGLQFSLVTWQDLGGTGRPDQAPKSTQIAMGKKLQARQGWNAWPSCARSLGWS